MMPGAKTKRPATAATVDRPAWPARLTQTAFWLLIAIVAARLTMLETLRDPLEPMAGASGAMAGAPRSPGPATSLGLDLLCCVPAFLILVRRIVDRTYVIRWGWSHAIMGALAAWAIVSPAWAGDRFAAIVSSANFAAAIVAIWSFTQLVRSWVRLRLVAGVMFGILLIYMAADLEYRLLDLPVMRRDFAANKEQILKAQGLEPGSFAAAQFAKKVIGGDVGQFSNSPNTFAAALVLMGLVAAGAAIQRIVNRDPIGWLVPMVLLLPVYAYVLYGTHSRAGIGLGALGLIVLGGVVMLRGRLQRRPALFYWAGVAAIAIVVLAVVGHGLRHNSLGEKSLTFRWYYWTGAARLVKQNPWLGVGSGNFGQRYLAVRVPGAVEEVQDPHNFVMKAFAELGIIGGVLTIAWMLRMWWEITRPVVPAAPAPATKSGGRTLFRLGAVAAGAMFFGSLVSIDWSQSGAWIFLQLFRYAFGALLLAAGMIVVSLEGLTNQELDERPAPWVLYAMLIGAGMFLLHNLLDFAISETSALFLFAMVAGAILGVRQPSVAGRKRQNALAASALVGAVLIWLIAAGVVWIPTVNAESASASGDDAMAAGQFGEAAKKYESARASQPLNAEYSYRAACALIRQGANRNYIRGRIESAIQANSYSVKYQVLRGSFEMQLNKPDRGAVDLAYQTALDLDPRSVRLRVDYAVALAKLGDVPAARRRLHEAERLKDELPADEPERTAAEADIAAAEKQIKSVAGRSTTAPG